jgi:hypothetical protein
MQVTTYKQDEIQQPSGFSVEARHAPETREEEGPGPRAWRGFFDFRDHHGYEQWIDMAGLINARSQVMVSICELGVFGGQVKPFQGAASMEVHNVTPHDDGLLIVRGAIGWDSDINVRLNIFVA